MKNERKPFDFILFFSVIILLALGLIMVFSASAPTSYNRQNDIYYILKNQLIFAAIGFAAMFGALNFCYRKIAPLSPFILAGSLILLILVLIPGIGSPINDTWRWINIGGFRFQPSETTKFAVILFFSWSLSKKREQLKYFFKGFIPYILIVAVISFLLLKEPHLSGTIIIFLISCIILFAAGAKIKHFLILAIPALSVFAVIVTFVDYMRARVTSFLNPFNDMQGDGWQVVQSLYAIGSGGLFGRGLGRSMQKFLYIPEPQNDFIFAIIAEELGFIGVLFVMVLFLIFIWRGIKISVNAPDIFGSLLAVGITSLIAVQTLFNVAVVTSSVPTTGVSLPFFSSGGTSLIMFMFEVGILLNISKYSNYKRI